MNTRTPPRIIWAIRDGKPGHDNQVRGLVDALAERACVEVHELQPLTAAKALLALLGKRFPNKTLPRPELVIGAGHATHLTLLAVRRATGAKAIVLMKPSLPARWFDLCVVPAHDALAPADNVFVTQGVLNRMRAGAIKDPQRGVILIGGESRHGDWDSVDIVRQVKAVVEQDPAIHWVLTTSRRTPASFVRQCNIGIRNLRIVPVEQTRPEWLRDQLLNAAWAWVTEDSVSMLYECMTAGAAVGVLELSYKKDSRVMRGVRQLIEAGQVTPFSQWQSRPRLQLPRQPFNEAQRTAEEIVKRWPIDA